MSDEDGSQFVFAYRHNGDGYIDSICLTCYLTAGTADNEAELHEQEKTTVARGGHRNGATIRQSTARGTRRLDAGEMGPSASSRAL
jgi:hypothetical protein